MNWLDIVILVIVAIAVFLGLRIGIIKAALTLVGLIIGIILAGHYYMPLSEKLTFIPQAGVAEVVAFAIIFIGIMIIAGALAVLLKWATSITMLGWVNHLGGAVFGLVMGALFISALLAICVKFLGPAEVISKSTLANVLLDHFPLVLALLPEEFDAIRSFFQ